MENQTDRINRLLVLWLDLQQACKLSQSPPALPWESADESVARLWNEITHPRNQNTLEEWLFHVASGQSERWAQRALQECRQRSSKRPT